MTRPATTITSLDLARWLEMPHEEVVRLTVTRAAFLLNTRGDYWARLAQHFQPRLFLEESGGLAREGYALSREGLLHVLRDLPDSPRVRQLRQMSNRAASLRLLRSKARELTAALDQPPQPKPQGTQP